MSKLLKSLFFRLFWSRVGGEGEESSGGEGSEEIGGLEDDLDGGEGEEGGEEGEGEELSTEVEAAPPARQPSRAQREIINLRERAQKAEQDALRAQAQLEEARRGTMHQPQSGTKTQEQELWEQEEAILKDPNAESWHKYSINAAREARAARAESQRAAMNAADAADRAEFAKLQATKPKTYEKYSAKVEEMLQSMRKAGNNAPRSELLALMLGRDLLSGAAKPEKPSAKPTGGASRGKTPGARSDVSGGKASQSDYDKAMKRLEGRII